VVNADYQYS